jgi:outer membrane lipoprotein-sorting protein
VTIDRLTRLTSAVTITLTLLSVCSAVWIKPAWAEGIPRPPMRPAEFGPSIIQKPSAPAAPAQGTVPPAPPVAAPAPPSPAPSSVTITRPDANKPMTSATPAAEVLKRVNAALNASPYFSAYFTQLVGNRQSEGQVYVMKPGKLRFDYDPPVPTEIIADGSSVAVRDTKMATQDIYPIGQTPLKFLTRDQIDLSRDLKVTGIRVDPDRVIIAVEDHSTFAGTSKVTLFFEQPSLLLKQWIVVDPQGVEISVVLNDINTKDRPDPKLFVIDFQQYK